MERRRGGEERSVGTKKEERSGAGGKQKINTSLSKSQAIGGRGVLHGVRLSKTTKKGKKKKDAYLPGSRETSLGVGRPRS